MDFKALNIKTILDSCQYLELSGRASFAACYYFHAYHHHIKEGSSSSSHHKPDHFMINCAVIFLASKVSEESRRIRDVMNVVKAANGDNVVTMDFDEAYMEQKWRIFEYEQIILRITKFQTDCGNPYRHLLQISKFNRLPREVVLLAITTMNDSLISPHILTTPTDIMALASIMVALIVVRNSSISDPDIKSMIRAYQERNRASKHEVEQALEWMTSTHLIQIQQSRSMR